MIRPIGDRFVYNGYTFEVVPEMTCEGCFFADGGCPCTMDDETFEVFGHCATRPEGVVFKVVGKDGDLAIGHETLVYNKKVLVEKANVDEDGIDLCEGCTFDLVDCGWFRNGLKLGRCNQTRYDKTGVIFRLVEEGGDE